MPRQKLGWISSNENPGPGNYQPKRPEESPYWGFGSAMRKTMADTRNNPAPGTYESKTYMGGKEGKASYSMRLKCDLLDHEGRGKPGPNAYQPSLDFSRTNQPKFGIGTGLRPPLVKKNKNPGPGSYGDKSSLNRQSAPFYTESREYKLKSKAPGPGTYENKTNIEDNVDKSKGYSCAQKLAGNKKDKVVGPGAYDPDYDFIKKNASKFGIGTEDRTRNYNTPNPGPGTYESKGTNEASQWGYFFVLKKK